MFRLCVDPGLHSAGASIWTDATLVTVQRFTPDRTITESHGTRCLDIAEQIGRWSCGVLGNSKTEVVFEWPQQYDSRKGKTVGNPNNLTPLAGVGMALVGMIWMRGSLEGDPVTPMPAQWVGQIPKKCVLCDRAPGKKSCKLCGGSAWKTPRGNMIRDALRPLELALVPDQNDVIDSVGIGLWRAGRLRLALPGLVTG